MRYAVIVPVAIAAAAWTLTPVDALAQTRQSTASVDVARAVELERDAEIASSERRRWLQAASLFQEASRLRPENDPIGLGDLRMAGAIYAELGQFERARRTMLALADRAIEFGEVATAAHALIEAAHIAVELNNATAARGSHEQAQRLAMSSHLTSEEQREITRRLESTQGLFAGP